MLAGLIRTIGTVILIWFVFRWLDRMSKRWTNRSSSSMGQKVNRKTDKESAPPQDDHLGDYVDFEELNDKD